MGRLGAVLEGRRGRAAARSWKSGRFVLNFIAESAQIAHNSARGNDSQSEVLLAAVSRGILFVSAFNMPISAIYDEKCA